MVKLRKICARRYYCSPFYSSAFIVISIKTIMSGGKLYGTNQRSIYVNWLWRPAILLLHSAVKFNSIFIYDRIFPDRQTLLKTKEIYDIAFDGERASTANQFYSPFTSFRGGLGQCKNVQRVIGDLPLHPALRIRLFGCQKIFKPRTQLLKRSCKQIIFRKQVTNALPKFTTWFSRRSANLLSFQFATPLPGLVAFRIYPPPLRHL